MLFLGFASNGETKRISTTAAASRILRSAERARRGRPCVDMLLYPAPWSWPLDDESEDDSLPPWPDRLEEETLAHRFAALRRAAAHRRWGQRRVAQLLSEQRCFEG